MDEHAIRPWRRQVVRAEIFVAERVLLIDYVAFQRARKARSTTQSVNLEYGTEYLAHNLRRQLNTKGTSNSVPDQVAVLGLAIGVDTGRVGEHVRLLCLTICTEEHAERWGNIRHCWHVQGRLIHVAP